MNAWDLEEAADSLIDHVLVNCEATMTKEQTVDFLLYFRELIDYATQVALLEVQKH